MKWKWNRGRLASHLLIAGVLWVAKIVENDVDVQLVRDSSFDLSEELFELHRSMPRVALPNDLAGGGIECCK